MIIVHLYRRPHTRFMRQELRKSASGGDQSSKQFSRQFLRVKSLNATLASRERAFGLLL